MSQMTEDNADQLIDRFGRHITYVRLSVTDRCDLRCVYCMSEDMQFLPREQLLTLEETARLGRCFSELGVTKLRITGGEPLVRRNVVWLFEQLGALPGIRDLTLTTNGSQLARYATALKDAGVDPYQYQPRQPEARALPGHHPQRRSEQDPGRHRRRAGRGLRARQAEQRHAQAPQPRRGGRSGRLCARPRHGHQLYRGDAARRDRRPRPRRGLLLQRRDPPRPRRTLSSCSPPPRPPAGRRATTVPRASRTGSASSPRTATTSAATATACASPPRAGCCCAWARSSRPTCAAPLRANPLDDDSVKRAIRAAMAIKPRGHDFDLKEHPIIFRHMNATGG